MPATRSAPARRHEPGTFLSPDGLMPADGPKTVYKVLSAFDPTVKGHTVGLSKTCTDDFVDKAG
ncbi:hypothetical protein [Streptomyces sp. NPDC096311]|uniref:hypothetical protein n=1 Tax=Streptomyces sp. NPDC096311 TaxID=3366083 RepID=UPI0038048B04